MATWNILFFCYISFLSFVLALRFEAEEGHIIRSTLPYHDGSELVQLQNETDRIIFTIHIPTDDIYLMQLKATASIDTSVDISANGYESSIFQLFSTEIIHTNKIWLRQGLNTLIIQKRENDNIISLDYIDVLGAIPLTSRGATLPYVEYEAEAQQHNGVVIGPSRDYYTLPGESSGRRAVQLSNGQQINFTLTSSSNGIVVRLSIPDSSDGNGLNGSLGVNVNGKQTLTLPVTSKYSWTYGNYPFTNNPSDGLGHHFYDDTRALFGSTLSAGTVITLTPLTSGFNYTIDLADFYTVPDPYAQPANSLDVTTYGADPTGKVDSTDAFQRAIDDGSRNNSVVWMPRGTYSVSRITAVNKVTVRGAGPWYTSVTALIPHGVGFFGNSPSSNVNLYDFAIFGVTEYRDDAAADSGVGGGLSNTLVQNLWIEHTKCGIWVDGNMDSFHVTGVTIRNTWADGVNFHRGVTNSIVEQSMLRTTGDDALAMWTDSVVNVKNVFQFNTITNPVLANGAAIYGGTDNSITDNYIADTLCEGGALQVSNRFNSIALAGTTILARNTCVRSGSPNHDNSNHNGALWFWAQQYAMNSLVQVSDLQVLDSSYAVRTVRRREQTTSRKTYLHSTSSPFWSKPITIFWKFFPRGQKICSSPKDSKTQQSEGKIGVLLPLEDPKNAYNIHCSSLSSSAPSFELPFGVHRLLK